MSTLVAAAGRFQMDMLARASLEAAGADRESGGWGIAYCYGNRLETIRSGIPCAQDPDTGKLSEVRTDMAIITIGGSALASPREVRPYLRRESGHTWAFGHQGLITHQDRLDTGGRITDSKNPSEKYFLYLLSRLKESDPVESAVSALAALGEEDSLSFCMLCCEMMLVGCWHGETPESAQPLWLGQGGLAKYISSKPLYSLPEVQWEAMPNRNVFAITRARRELP